MTSDETAMLLEIGGRVAGRRHRLTLLTDARLVELVSALTEQGLTERCRWQNRRYRDAVSSQNGAPRDRSGGGVPLED